MFKLRLLRAALIDGRRVVAGTVVAVSAPQAAELITGGDAMLTDDRDLPRLCAALGLQNGQRRPLSQPGGSAAPRT